MPDPSSSDRVGLDGSVAVVTGAGRGLGLAYASALAAAGASVVVNDADEQLAHEAVAAITAAGGKAVAHVAAIGSTEAAEGVVARAVESFGKLDVLVTNAGILRDKVLWKMSDDDFDAVINVHLRGTFTCARAAVQHMRERGAGGRLILDRFAGRPARQLRADELLGGQGRDHRHGPHLVDGMRAGRHHRQRRRADRRDRDDLDDPGVRAVRRGVAAARRTVARLAASRRRLRHTGRRRSRSSCSSPPRRPRTSPASASASAATG